MKIVTRFFLCLVISFTLVELPIMKAHAGMITTGQAVEDITRIQVEKNMANLLDRSEVKDQLLKLGVSPIEINSRLANLSDAEVKKLSIDMENATAGGSVVGILVVVLIVLGIIYLAKRI